MPQIAYSQPSTEPKRELVYILGLGFNLNAIHLVFSPSCPEVETVIVVIA